MNDTKKSIYAKYSLICGILMLVCGLIITGICLSDHEFEPTYRLISGIVFIVAGALYIVVSTQRLKR